MANFKQLKILLVDDTPALIDVLRSMLSEEGFEISIAMTGEKALGLIEKNRPDLIFLDVMMPGIDGFKTCERVKTNPKNKDLPVIFVTSKTEIEDIVRGFQVGSVDYIAKPFTRGSRFQTHLKIQQFIQEKESQNKQLMDQNDELIAS
jgi:two-component system sensor histidine kinase/response regulator